MTYQALQIEKDDDGYRCTLKTLDDSALPEGDVTVQVAYSTVNYKDGLAICIVKGSKTDLKMRFQI